MRLIEHFFRTLAPSDCLRCGDEGSLVCNWCLPEAIPEIAGRCYACNALSHSSSVCTVCRRKTPIRHLWMRAEYSDIAKQLVHVMKFKYSAEAADVIAAELANTLPALSPDVLIVHVPTVTNHVRERGFDHSKRMAVSLSRITGLQYLPALARVNQLRQVGSNRRDRLQQMAGAFRVRDEASVRGARILLVDDVLTTGATIEAAARTLKAAGAKSVDAVIFARAK